MVRAWGSKYARVIPVNFGKYWVFSKKEVQNIVDVYLVPRPVDTTKSVNWPSVSVQYSFWQNLAKNPFGDRRLIYGFLSKTWILRLGDVYEIWV
jgi:hypothetical protein